MQTIEMGSSGVQSSRLVYGCMRIAGDNTHSRCKQGKQAVRAAIEHGYTLFDHADIYAGGLSERLFSEVLQETPTLRQQILIASKCGIRCEGEPDKQAPARYDFSKRHIIDSVEGSLRRLNVEYLDFLLLHRPDYLFLADEVADALLQLKNAGKVRHFGVSNFKPSQLSLLQSRCPFELVVNQVEINIHNISAFTDGTLDQCQQQGITPQAWCPLATVAYPAWGNTFSPQDEERILAELSDQADRYGVENWVLMLAWLLKHPAGIMPIIGSTTVARIQMATQALQINYSREDWYRLLQARNGRPVD